MNKMVFLKVSMSTITLSNTLIVLKTSLSYWNSLSPMPTEPIGNTRPNVRPQMFSVELGVWC